MLYSSTNPEYCIFPQQADVEKKKLEDRGRVEKDKKKYARLVEDCKQKTERQKIALSEVVKAQKELILANSEVAAQFYCCCWNSCFKVNAMTKQYFEEDMPILVNCADLGFHQVCILFSFHFVRAWLTASFFSTNQILARHACVDLVFDLLTSTPNKLCRAWYSAKYREPFPSESEKTGECASGQHGADDKCSAKSQQVNNPSRIQAWFKVKISKLDSK